MASLLKELRVDVADTLGAVPFMQLAQTPTTIMWTQNGKCQCGRRSSLCSQCGKFLQAEKIEDLLREHEQVEQEEIARERPWSSTEELIAGGREPPLPGVLPMPLVRHGKNSDHVLFVFHEG